MSTFALNADLIRAASAWTYKGKPEDMRYPGLNYIRVEPHREGGVIVATCAHAMFAAHDPYAMVPEPALLQVPQDLVGRLGGAASKRSIRYTNAEIALYDGGARVGASRTADPSGFLVRGARAHYVDWRRGFPSRLEFKRANPAIPTVMNVEFLKRLAEMWGGWDEHRNVVFATCGKPAIDPLVGKPTDRRHFFAFLPWRPNVILMFAPMGGTTDPRDMPYPGWVEAPIEDPASGL